MLNLVSNLQYSYQTAASAATPLPLFRTGWTILSKEYVLLGLLTGRLRSLCPASSVRPIWTTDFLQSSLFVPPALLLASRSRFPLSTFSVLLSSLHTLVLTSQGALTRSLSCS